MTPSTPESRFAERQGEILAEQRAFVYRQKRRFLLEYELLCLKYGVMIDVGPPEGFEWDVLELEVTAPGEFSPEEISKAAKDIKI